MNTREFEYAAYLIKEAKDILSKCKKLQDEGDIEYQIPDLKEKLKEVNEELRRMSE